MALESPEKRKLGTTGGSTKQDMGGGIDQTPDTSDSRVERSARIVTAS